ncbi:MAG: DoxX family protein [Cytophagia bacterium]|nr:DoxX family protein [Cytophagia bacterium]NBW36395.1 DoxX family protein [Cytophagia bacterium]
MKTKEILFSVARYVSAIILAQTLFFKFTGAAESVYIFTAVGMEPWGRIGVGIAELAAAILLIYKRFSWVGAGLSIGMMSGAIMMHLLIIGIEVMDDGGELFFLALTVLLLCSYVFYQQRTSWLPLLKRK